MRNREPSALQCALERANNPDVLSLALGMPAPEFFPTADLAEAARRAFEQGSRLLQYGMPRQQLKEHVAELMHWRGVECVPGEVFLTSGAQQALALLTMLLAPSPGTAILVDDAVYPGFRQAAEPSAPVLVPVRRSGLERIDAGSLLEAARANPRPAFLFTMSAGHNPFGATMTDAARRELIEAAASADLPIVEDDVYGLLQYEDTKEPPLCSLDRERVFYVGSFSKILGPALRTGWIIAPQRWHTALSVLKEGCDINTGTLAQGIIREYLERNSLRDHIARLRTGYRQRRDALDRSLARHFDGSAQWQKPSAGFFFWVRSDLFAEGGALLSDAIANRVAFVPGSAFSVSAAPECRNAIRLSFSCCPIASMDEAIRRIAEVVERRAGLLAAAAPGI